MLLTFEFYKSRKFMKARSLGIFLRVIVLSVVSILLYINSKKTKKIKQQLQTFTFSEFDSFFEKFIQHKFEIDYIGLQINAKNHLYFVNIKNKINIEFEILEKQQIALAQKLEDYATKRNFKILKTSYGNKTNYDNTIDAPVYQILCKLNAKNASIIAEEILRNVFNCNETTSFKIVN